MYIGDSIEVSLSFELEGNRARIGGAIFLDTLLDFNIISIFVTYVCVAHGSLLVLYNEKSRIRLRDRQRRLLPLIGSFP